MTVTRILLSVSSIGLMVVVVGAIARDRSQVVLASTIDVEPFGVLRSAGFLFFAFAGYARVATLGEEVRDPAVTIPRAIPRALLAVLVVYLVVGLAALWALPAGALALEDAPLAAVVESGSLAGLTWVVSVGAAVASLGVLLNLIPGVARTVLAMARRRELPGWFALVDERRSLPVRAEVSVAAVTVVLVHTLSITSSIAVSGVAVLTYYALTNLAALRLEVDERRWPPTVAIVGLVGCIALVASLPPEAIAGGAAVIIAGVAVRAAGAAGRAAVVFLAFAAVLAAASLRDAAAAVGPPRLAGGMISERGTPLRSRRRTSAGRGGISAAASARRSSTSIRSSRRVAIRSAREGGAAVASEAAAATQPIAATKPQETTRWRGLPSVSGRKAMTLFLA